MWFKYDQNNSGGSFVFEPNRGISHYVWVEADSREEADERAKSIGLYFNGCEDEIDCDCCGDRWYPMDRPWNTTGEDEQPPPVGETFAEFNERAGFVHSKWIDGPETYVHPKQGEFYSAHNGNRR